MSANRVRPQRLVASCGNSAHNTVPWSRSKIKSRAPQSYEARVSVSASLHASTWPPPAQYSHRGGRGWRGKGGTTAVHGKRDRTYCSADPIFRPSPRNTYPWLDSKPTTSARICKDRTHCSRRQLVKHSRPVQKNATGGRGQNGLPNNPKVPASGTKNEQSTCSSWNGTCDMEWPLSDTPI